MVTTGMAYFAMACIYWIVDSRRWWNGTPFLYAGEVLFVLGTSIKEYAPSFQLYRFLFTVVLSSLFQRIKQQWVYGISQAGSFTIHLPTGQWTMNNGHNRLRFTFD